MLSSVFFMFSGLFNRLIPFIVTRHSFAVKQWSFVDGIQSPATTSAGWTAIGDGCLERPKQCQNGFHSLFVIREWLDGVRWEFRSLCSQSGSVRRSGLSPAFSALSALPLYLSLTLPLCFAANASSSAPLPECLASSQFISTVRSSPMSICPW